MVLPMIVYTSGFLHAGHIRSYTNCDMLVRWLKIVGKKVMFPFGYDSHGLPTELKAIEEGKNPITWINECMEVMSSTLKRLNFDFNWEKLINTSSPDYYLLQQHMFVELYKHGFIYRARGLVNWDPVAKTTLANEQVVEGKSERTGATIELIEKEQWFLRLSTLARELHDDLQDLTGCWPDLIINAQREWIGYKNVFKWSHQLGSETCLYSETNLESYSYLMVRDNHLVDKLIEAGFEETKIKFNKRLPENEVWISKDNKEDLLSLPVNIGKPEKVEHVALRDWCISRQRSFGCVIPACYCEVCGWVVDHSLVSLSPINESEFKPLLEFKNWVKVRCPRCDSTASREVDTLDTLFDSSWYPIKYCDVLRYSNELGLHVQNDLSYLPVSYYIGGREHATGHLMYIRGMFLCLNRIFDVIPKKPVINFVMNGMITAPFYKNSRGDYVYLDKVKKKEGKYMIDDEEVFKGTVEKMSKSKKNVVRADTLLESFSSDTIRLAILSDYPIFKDYTWYADSVDKVKNSVKLFESYLRDSSKKVSNLWWWSLTSKKWEDLRERGKLINRMFSRCEMNKIIAKLHEWVHDDLSKKSWCTVTLLTLTTLMPETANSYLSNETLRSLSLLYQHGLS